VLRFMPVKLVRMCQICGIITPPFR